MIDLVLVGIGTGNPEHLTLQAIREINAADLILIPRKGPGKTDLADLRQAICAHVLTNPDTRIAEFDMPRRNADDPDYLKGVDQWHEAVAGAWNATIHENLPQGGTVALLVWGDPALYDSTLRIAARLSPSPRVRSIPGIMSLNMLAAAHTIALNDIGAPFLVTTGRQLRDHGWPQGVDTLVVMLDGECSFQHLSPDDVTIYWGAYVGMAEQILLSGPLTRMAPQIIDARDVARARHGWIMDIYLLRRTRKPRTM
ncbi:precorrin-6A synthase (deacetylating) [Acetobacter conturbans]|uniref:Precorrin-6A synthase [deacetylating] n=1 Tax=Acetobacter conturbans TaxID=1737472 RepID=A0ABX0JU62_9PROT|nr:precorrin-6A synthase (deacetylating) [Acetobacter conturbans]NHN87038.1 precorrin-6A synthase (deacetylating) [Acetobacter conturbans]